LNVDMAERDYFSVYNQTKHREILNNVKNRVSQLQKYPKPPKPNKQDKTKPGDFKKFRSIY